MFRTNIALNTLLLAGVVGFAAPGAQADSAPAARKAAHQTDEPLPVRAAPELADTGGDDVLVLGAPPREAPEIGRKLYDPVAEHLGRTLGRRVVYRHPGNWLSYQTEMQKGGYDIVFDGPHFNSWRLQHLQHDVLARFAEEHQFAVIVRKDNAAVTDLRQLAGKPVCGMNPPNLGTLAFLAHFDNPARQPVMRNTTGWERIYSEVISGGQCVAGIVPVAVLSKHERNGTASRVIFRSRILPNQAFSAGPRLDRAAQARIAQALMSAAGSEATAALRAAYGSDRGLVPASRTDYAGLDSYLQDVWGYRTR